MSNETIYTFDSDDIYFLNDKNIVSAINENARINGIPSQVLFKQIYNELSSADKALSDIISAEFIEFKDTVETSCDNISTLIGSVSTDLSNAITTNSKHIDELQLSTEQISGEVSRFCAEISADVKAKYSKLTSDDNFISAETGRLYAELSDNVENKFVHKEGDNVRWLSVANGLSATTLKVSTTGKEIATEQFTTVQIDKDGIRADAIGDGKEIALSTNNSTNGIMINGTSLSSHIKNEVRISADETLKLAKTYTDSEIQKLKFDDTVESKQFVTAVSETDGKITVQKAELVSSDIPTIEEAQVKNLTTDLQNLSTNYVAYTNFTTKNIDNDGKFLSAEDFNLTYDSTTHDISLKAGQKTYKFSAIEFIKNRTVHHLAIDRHDGKTWLKIFWTANEFIELDINELIQIYEFENGISAQVSTTGGIHVGATDELARTSYANAISVRTDVINDELQAEITRAKNAETINAEAINTEINRAETTENNLNEQINSISNDLTSEIKTREECDVFISNNVDLISNDIISFKSYANVLSSTDSEHPGIIMTLSNDVSALQYDAVKEIKFEGHIDIAAEPEAKSLSDLFAELHLGIDDSWYVKNGSIYDVSFTSNYPISNAIELTDNNIKLGNGDYLIVHDHDNLPLVDYRTLNNGNCYLIKAGTSRYEFEKEIADRTSAEEALAGHIDTIEGEGEGSIKKALADAKDYTDTTISALDVAEVTVGAAKTIASISETDGKIATEAIAIQIDESQVTDLTTDLDTLSANDKNLSDCIEHKVWIKDITNTVLSDGDFTNLSVIKIAKDEYDTLVADKSEMLSGNTLYIVDSDYIDAYGQQLCNLTMSNDSAKSYVGIAATNTYVDEKMSEVQSQLNQVSSTFANVFANISGITLNSQLSDLLSATIEIAKILSCFNI